MRPVWTLTFAALLWQAGHCAALGGRWEGQAQTPGAAVPVLIDIVPGAAVLTLPGRSTQRERLTLSESRGGVLRAAAASDPDVAEADALRLVLRPAERGRVLVGSLHQGGHAAPLRLVRVSDAPALDAIPTMPIPEMAHGVWRGRYDMGFGERAATLRLSAQGNAMTVVGRRTSEIVFDGAVQRGAFLMLTASAAGVSIEAPAAGAAAGVLQATVRQGPFEAALELRREAAP
jgi:hypothetical protein